MNKAVHAERVGKDSQCAATARRIALNLQTDEGGQVAGTFTAPMIADSDLPPLLGLTSLKSFGALLDMISNKLYLPGRQGATSNDVLARKCLTWKYQTLGT